MLVCTQIFPLGLDTDYITIKKPENPTIMQLRGDRRVRRILVCEYIQYKSCLFIPSNGKIT